MDGRTVIVCAHNAGLNGTPFRSHHLARFEHRTTTVNGEVLEDKSRWIEAVIGEIGYTIKKPTHWMPLPDLPGD